MVEPRSGGTIGNPQEIYFSAFRRGTGPHNDALSFAYPKGCAAPAALELIVILICG